MDGWTGRGLVRCMKSEYISTCLLKGLWSVTFLYNHLNHQPWTLSRVPFCSAPLISTICKPLTGVRKFEAFFLVMILPKWLFHSWRIWKLRNKNWRTHIYPRFLLRARHFNWSSIVWINGLQYDAVGNAWKSIQSNHLLFLCHRTCCWKTVVQTKDVTINQYFSEKTYGYIQKL